MVINKENTTTQQNWPWWRRILTGLNALALVLTGIMSWHFIAGGPIAGCSGGSPCEQVLSGRWSMIAGLLPVSGLALGVYLAILAASFFIGPATEETIRRMAWSVLLILAGSVAGSAVWFTILQKWVIGDFCPYCMATHITGLLVASLIIWRSVSNSAKPLIRRLPAAGRVTAGLVLAGTLAAFQAGFNPAVADSNGESEGSLPSIDYKTAPMVGSPDAPYIVTLLFDYQCSHCQKIHFMLDDAVRRYAGKLAFVLCPAPLNTTCNPYIPRDADEFRNSCELAKTGLAVWIAGRDAFPAFENWMFTFESGDGWRPRSPESARAKATELVGQSKFDAALTDPWIGKYLQVSTQIYGQTIANGKGGVPKLVFGSRWVIPEVQNADELVKILQKSLAVPIP